MSRVRSTLVCAVAACACLGVATPALADDPPPDLSLSTLSCQPENAVPPLAGSTRPGDYVLCQLKAAVTGPSNAYQVTAGISIPPGTAYAPLPNAQGDPQPADAPTEVVFDTSKLGLINPGLPKAASVRLRIADDAVAGAPIQPQATLRDPQAATFTATANLLSVMPQQADLSPSTTTCENVDPSRADVRAGDTIDCTFLLASKPQREDAVGVSLTAAIPSGTAWAPGGNETFHFNNNVNWYGAVLGAGVPSGGSAPPLHLRVTVDPSLPGGSIVYVNGTVGWTNAQSLTTDTLGLGAAPIVVTPGPAVLSASALACVDVDGGALLPLDLVDCTATIRPAAGHEGVTDVAGSAAVPALTNAVTSPGGDGRIALPAAVLGAIGSGASKAASYRLRVAAEAQPGNVIVPTATVSGRSVPSGGTFTLPLQGSPLVVGTRVVAQPTPPKPVAAAGAVAGAGAPAGSRAPVICASRRVVIVNVRPPTGRRWRTVRFAFAGKSVAAKKATGTRGRKGYFRARLVFQGLPKGPLKVAITGVTTRGRTVRGARTYNLCTKRR